MNIVQIHKRKIALFNAILSLENLIKNGNTKENDYQHCLEKNPIIFESLGYTEFYAFTKEAKKKLPKDELTNLQPEPDFIVKNSLGLYEIFEIKTPIDKNLIINSNNYRKRFTAELSSYISQTITYNDYFRNPANRKTIEELFDIKIQEDLPQNIIFGLEKNIDAHEVHKLITRYKDRINIMTYTKILENLERAYNNLQGGEEGITGYSFHLKLDLSEKQKNEINYIFDLGETPHRNRVSLFINNKKELCFEVYTKDEIKYELKIQNNTIFSKQSYIVFELGVLEDMFFLSSYINKKEIEKKYIYSQIHIEIENIDGCIGFSEINKNKGCKFLLYALGINNHTMTFRERTYMFHIFSSYTSVALNFDNHGGIKMPKIPKIKNNNNPDPTPLCLLGIGADSPEAKKYLDLLYNFVYPI